MGLLCEHFARDAVDVDELERRLDKAHRASSADDLRALLVDLPGGATALAHPDATPSPGVGLGSARGVDAAPRGRIVAIFGGVRRRGSWTPALFTKVVAIWGGVELDFREARMAPGVTEVRAVAVMGGVDIIVPPGVWVETDGIAILGGFDHRVDTTPPAGAPVLRLTGAAILGGVQVSVRQVGESEWDAARRRRRERRESRRERRTLGGQGRDD